MRLVQQSTVVGAQDAKILEEVLRQSFQAEGSGVEGLQAVGHSAARRDGGLGVPLLNLLRIAQRASSETGGERPENLV
jgi:hypothetical protein